MIKNLSKVKRITEEGEYIYIGFLLHTMNDVIKVKGKDDIINCGENFSLFKNVKTDEFVFVSNYDIKEFSNELPYGVFQKEMSKFNNNFDIEIKDGVVNFIINEVIKVGL